MAPLDSDREAALVEQLKTWTLQLEADMAIYAEALVNPYHTAGGQEVYALTFNLSMVKARRDAFLEVQRWLARGR